MRSRRPPLLLASLLLMGLVLSSCHDERITTQQVPKGSETIVAEVEDSASATASEALRIWRLPEGWSEVPTRSAMRLATFMVAVPDGAPVEVAVTSFPGDVGGDLANVNRWREQLGLKPLAPEKLEEALDRFSSPGYAGYFVRLDGTTGTMLAAGIRDMKGSRSWFVRVVTTPATATALQNPIRAFAASFGAVSGAAQ